MATYVERPQKKTGVSNYSVRFSATVNGKVYKGHATWKNTEKLPSGKDGGKAKKAAIVFGEAEEKKFRESLERTKNSSLDKDITFEEIADKWLRLKQGNAQSHYSSVDKIVKRLKKEFGKRKFVTITDADIEDYFLDMKEQKNSKVLARIKPSAVEKFNTKTLEYGKRKMSADNIVARPTLAQARKGETIQWVTATTICKALDINTSEYFERVIIAKPYKRNTLKRQKDVLCGIYKFAIRRKLVKENCASMENLKESIGKDDTEAREILDEEGTNLLLDAIDNEQDETRILSNMPIYIMATTGCRLCEACGVDFSDVYTDGSRPYIHIRRGRLYIDGKIVTEDSTKTKKSTRHIEITDRLFDKIVEAKRHYDNLIKVDPTFAPCDAIYCNPNGTPANPQNVTRLLRKYLFEIGCKKNISPYSLRHGYITFALDHGENPKTIAKNVGNSASVTLEIYAKYRKETDKMVDTMNKIFSKSPATAPKTNIITMQYRGAEFEREVQP